MRFGSNMVVAAAVAALVGVAGSARAAEWGFLIDDHNPELLVPDEQQRAANPREFEHFTQELRARGEAASRRGDHLAAARYWSALAKAVPDRSLAYARLCRSLEALGEREGALDACADALARYGVTVDDFAHFVRLVLASPGNLTAADRRLVDDQIGMLRRNPAGTEVAEQLQCELAVRVGDLLSLRNCAPGLAVAASSEANGLAAALATRWPDGLAPLLLLVAVAGGAFLVFVRRRASERAT
jgi:hypothetical protein